MVHKALNFLESCLPPLLVRRLVGLPFWLYSDPFVSVRPSGRLEGQDEGLQSVIRSDSGYCGSRKPAVARWQNHLVLAALLYTRASSSCHLVKLPVSPFNVSSVLLRGTYWRFVDIWQRVPPV